MNVNFNTYVPPVNPNAGTPNTNGNTEFKVTAFTIRDGESAFVRFPYKSPNEFDLRTTHIIRVNNYYKKINCLGSVSECPLCARGDNLSPRFFAHLLHYTQGENGVVDIKAKVWDLPYSFAQTLNTYIQTYGDLSKVLFKVTRKGKNYPEYSLMVLPNEMYPTTVYKDDFKDFDNFKLTGYFCLNKNAQDISEYINTGRFPEANSRNSNNNQASAANYANAQPSSNHAESPAYAQPPVYTPPVAQASPDSYSVNNVATARTPQYNVPPYSTVGAPADNMFNSQSMEEVLQSQQPVRPTSYATPTDPAVVPTQEAAPRPRRYAY